MNKLLTFGTLLICLAGPARAQEATPAPYDGDLQRLAEILGSLQYLRTVCGAKEGQKWRTEMQALIDAERSLPGSDPAMHSLINSTDEFYVRAKATNVWWMLRKMIGETALTAALHNYKAEEDKDAMYMQRLIEAQSHRDLAWFFDDWVYRDRGLPDFRITAVFSRAVVGGGYLVTVTAENLGGAAAEVPVILRMSTRDAVEKLVVPGKSKASVRILAGSTPIRAIVNDGSVPESDMRNNEYTIELNQ